MAMPPMARIGNAGCMGEGMGAGTVAGAAVGAGASPAGLGAESAPRCPPPRCELWNKDYFFITRYRPTAAATPRPIFMPELSSPMPGSMS